MPAVVTKARLGLLLGACLATLPATLPAPAMAAPAAAEAPVQRVPLSELRERFGWPDLDDHSYDALRR